MSSNTNYNILLGGLWHNNPGIMQLLGLCPLLAVSNNTVSAITLGMASVLVLTLSNIIISSLKKYITYELRIPIFMLIIASMVTMIMLLMQSYSYSLYKNLGVYLALITTNCVILGRTEAFSYRNTVLKSALDGLANGIGFSLVLLLMGAIREIIGSGTLFANMHLLFHNLDLTIYIYNQNQEYNFIIALLPPGAFFTLGLIIALKNCIITYTKNNKSTIVHEQPATLSAIPKVTKS